VQRKPIVVPGTGNGALASGGCGRFPSRERKWAACMGIICLSAELDIAFTLLLVLSSFFWIRLWTWTFQQLGFLDRHRHFERISERASEHWILHCRHGKSQSCLFSLGFGVQWGALSELPIGSYVFSSFIAFGALHCVHKNWKSKIKIHTYISSYTSRSRKIIVIKFFEMSVLFLY